VHEHDGEPVQAGQLDGEERGGARGGEDGDHRLDRAVEAGGHAAAEHERRDLAGAQGRLAAGGQAGAGRRVEGVQGGQGGRGERLGRRAQARLLGPQGPVLESRAQFGE
jgi:hypothetical protein